MECEATAAIMRNISGFRIPSTGENVPILPITVHEQHWQDMIDSHAYDQWEWDPVNEEINPGSDGIPEVFLFPNQNDSAGNFGTVSFGTTANSNAHLTSQIHNGLSQSDLDYHGGELKFDGNGELRMNGDTGIDASLQNDLTAVAGEPRIIPLYRSVVNPGNTAEYTLVRWVGIRVMSATLTGGQKGVYIQPADVTLKGAVQGGEGQSEQIYTPVQIVK